MPKVSIILTTYNKPTFIVDAINSVIEQTFKDWELIIIADPPIDSEVDGFINSCVEKDLRIKYFKNEYKLGFRKCLNHGLKLAQGVYIARIDDDDIWDSQKLEKQMKFLDENPDYVLIGSGAIFIDENRKELYRVLPLQKDEDIRKIILLRNPFIHSSVVFLREKALEQGGYSEQLSENEDYDLWLRLGLVGKFSNLPEFLVKYREPFLKEKIEKIQRQRTRVFISIIKKYKKYYPNYYKAIILNYLRLFYSFLPKPKKLAKYLYKKRQENW